MNFLEKTYPLPSPVETKVELKSRRQLIEEILADPSLRARLQDLMPTTTDEYRARNLQSILYSIATNIDSRVVKLFSRAMSMFFGRCFQAVEISFADRRKVDTAIENSAVVFVPCHRSHIDYLLVGWVLNQYEFPPIHICAGENLSFWPLSFVFRRSGAYFIRRRFKKDSCYALALHGYVTKLLSEGLMQKIFIEGTRSRTGKLQFPRTGLLNMIVQSWLEQNIKDVYFVPVSIQYEKVPEIKTYINEIQGALKKHERLRDLRHLFKMCTRRLGRVYVRFSEPLSLREQWASSEKSSRKDAHLFVRGLAHKIAQSINRSTPLLAGSLVATVLLHARSSPVSFSEIQAGARALLGFARAQGFESPGIEGQELKSSLRETLDWFVKEGLIQTQFSLGPHGLRLFCYAVPRRSRPTLNFFKNNGLHSFIEPAMAKLCDTTFPDPGKALQRLKQLLSNEFFWQQEASVISSTELPDWVAEIPKPLLESYFLTWRALREPGDVELEFKRAPHSIIALGRRWLSQNRLHYAESVCAFTIRNALQVFVDMGLIDSSAQESPSLITSHPRFQEMEKLFRELFM
ncbi:MAG: 1-acyl-sn-glycerol-3-phosphate acyltransferase [Proteobacteria bacterium]|nr:1-acyl-sn-glycerol-3-phosphate acyltransferase [Pseudomonadota bacterium]